VTAIPIHGDTPAGVQVGDTWIDADSGELHVWAGQRVLRFVPLDDLALIAPRVEIGSYISFVALLALGVVIAFQLPVVLLVLGWSGAVDPAWLAQYRRYALFACFAVGAVFTPADPVSMVVLAVPLYLLFELGLILARLKKPRVPEEL
jgi:sec-independent protein translocase protein TatC